MGNASPSKLVNASKLVDSNQVGNLSFLEDGQFSKIYKGDFGSQVVSIKVPKVPDHIRKDKKCVKEHVEEVRRLVPNLRRPRGDNLLRVLGVSYDDFRKEVWVIREFVDGTDLETLIKNPSLCPAVRSPEKKMKVALGMSKGLSQLHHGVRGGGPVVHGDLELSDVLLDARTLQPKIANFGLWDFKNYFIRTTVPEHVSFLNPCQAPEVLLGGERPTLFSDRWSLGAALLHWLVELPPWDLAELCQRYRLRGDRQLSALRNAMDNEEDPTVLAHLSPAAGELDFLRGCFDYGPTSRPSAQDVEHRLLRTSQTPTWTNVAYHKYYS